MLSHLVRGSSLLLFVFLGWLSPAYAAEVLHVYGPGGPLPAMKEAAAVFGKQQGIEVMVTGGPTRNWLDNAKRDADLIYSGSEHMMTDFINALGGEIDASTVMPLYLRPSAILVRPGNPKQIQNLADVAKAGINVLVVQGAGQTGLWEDMAGRTGDINVVRAIRKNIRVYAPDSGKAKEAWTSDKNLDAWLIWNIWQVANPQLAEAVPVEREYVIYSDMGIAYTHRGKENAAARRFGEFLQGREGEQIFRKWGWNTRAQ